jgi:hypothetical protein
MLANSKSPESVENTELSLLTEQSEAGGDTCVHGGRVYHHIGSDFSRMNRVVDVLAADVLDAWYPPAPQVISQVQHHLEWACHTSPPLHG